MNKIHHTATAPDSTTWTRSTEARIYTHAALAFESAEGYQERLAWIANHQEKLISRGRTKDALAWQSEIAWRTKAIAAGGQWILVGWSQDEKNAETKLAEYRAKGCKTLVVETTRA